jgi:hypothetical protein
MRSAYRNFISNVVYTIFCIYFIVFVSFFTLFLVLKCTKLSMQEGTKIYYYRDKLE